jgi:hypothetical protein
MALSASNQPITNAASVEIISGGADNPLVLSGVADPSVAGLAAVKGTIYMRSSTTGELWIKSGAGNFDWVPAGAATGSIISHVASGAGRSSYGSQTPFVVGAFAFNPADYVVNAVNPTLAFRAVAANGAAALSNSVTLYNVTDASSVVTLSVTNTSITKLSAALVIGGGAGQIPNSEKIYEIQIYLNSDPLGDPNKTIELYSAHLVATSGL